MLSIEVLARLGTRALKPLKPDFVQLYRDALQDGDGVSSITRRSFNGAISTALPKRRYSED